MPNPNKHLPAVHRYVEESALQYAAAMHKVMAHIPSGTLSAAYMIGAEDALRLVGQTLQMCIHPNGITADQHSTLQAAIEAVFQTAAPQRTPAQTLAHIHE